MPRLRFLADLAPLEEANWKYTLVLSFFYQRPDIPSFYWGNGWQKDASPVDMLKDWVAITQDRDLDYYMGRAILETING